MAGGLAMFPLWHGKVATATRSGFGGGVSGFRFGMVKLQLAPGAVGDGDAEVVFPLWHGKVATWMRISHQNVSWIHVSALAW